MDKNTALAHTKQVLDECLNRALNSAHLGPESLERIAQEASEQPSDGEAADQIATVIFLRVRKAGQNLAHISGVSSKFPV